MRYIIVGAGAVGGTIGGRLYEAGHDVVLVARGAHYEALRADGLRLTLPDRVLNLPIPAVDRPESLTLRPDDVLVLAVKTQDTVGALDAWAGRPVEGGGTAGERLPVLCVQNGVANERLALRRFRTVYGVCVWLPATHLEPGAVVAPGAPLSGILHLGRYPAIDGADPTAERIAADWTASGFGTPLPPDVMPWKYAKLLGNLANALDAVTGDRSSPEFARLLEQARAEGEAALAAAGIQHPDAEEQARARGDQVQPRKIDGLERTGSSSWQSLTRGAGSIEADYLNGEIVLIGRLYGVRTPVNEVLQRVAAEFAREGRRPGDLTAAGLAELVAAESSGR